MARDSRFQGLFDSAKKTTEYWTERVVLEFTEDLVKQMESEGLSRAALAKRIGCSPAYVTKILRGNTNFTLESMVRVARALGCELRTHLQSPGARSYWMDILEGRSGNHGTFRNSLEMNEAFADYAKCKEGIKETGHDSIPLAS